MDNRLACGVVCKKKPRRTGRPKRSESASKRPRLESSSPRRWAPARQIIWCLEEAEVLLGALLAFQSSKPSLLDNWLCKKSWKFKLQYALVPNLGRRQFNLKAMEPRVNTGWGMNSLAPTMFGKVPQSSKFWYFWFISVIIGTILLHWSIKY